MKSQKAPRKVMPTSKGKILSVAVRTYANELARDPKQASDFLKRAGIITTSGKLSANYR
jgi:hypothetical protein